MKVVKFSVFAKLVKRYRECRRKLKALNKEIAEYNKTFANRKER